MPKKVPLKYYTPPADSMIVNREEIISIEEIKNFDDGRTKTCFRCKSTKKPEGILCVYWKKISAQVGDLVNMKGRMTPDGTFIVWDMQILNGVNDTNKATQQASSPIVKGGNNDS